jgi:PIN domain nuclease of toxin-antitoxin system
MRLLLDTHALLWALVDEKQLHAKALRAISNQRNQVYVSSVSAWELSVKRAAGKLKHLPENIEFALETSQFLPLPLTLLQAWRAGELPLLHGDPFDRLLIAQAQMESLTLVTRDEKILQYAVPCVEA